MTNTRQDEFDALEQGWLDLVDRVNEAEESLSKENASLRASILAHIEKFHDLPERSGKRKNRVEAILESCANLLENLDMVETGEYDEDSTNEAFLSEHGIEINFPDVPQIEVKKRRPFVVDSNPNSIDDTGVRTGMRCVYIWRVTGTNVFKVGVTSPHLGLGRLYDVINALGHDAEILRVIRVANETDAFQIEAIILASCAARVPVDMKRIGLSGRQEFVEFFEHQIPGILEFMDANHLP